MAQFSFNAAEVSPESQFAPVPNGDYPVIIVASEMKPTKAGTGEYLQLEIEIIDGPYKGKKVWDRLNLVNPNQTAVEIAQQNLSQICHAVGHLNLQDTAELHGKPMIAKLVIKSSPGYDDSNEVVEYKPSANVAAASSPVDSQAVPPAASHAPTGGGEKPSWA